MYIIRFSDSLDVFKTKQITVQEGIYPFRPKDPVKPGYRFRGWFTDAAFTKPFNWKSIVTKNMTLYAGWDVLDEEFIEKSLDYFLDELINQTQSFIPAWNQEDFKGRWNYIDGVFLNSIVNLYHYVENSNPELSQKYKDFFIRYINYYVGSEGDFRNLGDVKKAAYATNELDSVCESRVLFDALELTGDDRYLKAIEFTYDNLMKMPIVKNSNGNFWHKASYINQIWLDGLYMYAPFLCRYAILRNNFSYFDKIKSQYEFIRKAMFNEEKGLYYHGYDSTKEIFWCNKKTGCSNSFWLRSMGWFFVSIVDVLDYFPEGEDHKYLQGLLKEALEGVLKYQDPTTKMFYQLVDQGPKSFFVKASYFEQLPNNTYKQNGEYIDAEIQNYLESSGSSMVAYACMKGARKGYLSKEYMAIGKEIYQGVYEHSFNVGDTFGLKDICITAGLGPNSRPHRDGSPAYYLAEPVGANDAKGVGPFIMAYLEYKY